MARHLVTISPGGFESMFCEIGIPVKDSTSDPADRDSTIPRGDGGCAELQAGTEVVMSAILLRGNQAS
jgi:hypothetical protein